VIELNKNNYEKEIAENNSVIVDFWGETCAPCKELTPIIKELEKKYKKIKFASLDAQSNKKIAIKFRILGLPAIIFFKNGKEIKRLIKNQCTKDNIEKNINQFLLLNIVPAVVTSIKISL
jgi:thioredoxin 1